ncbi:CGNR zinc finger domain-containing protein [Paenibacillus sp. R14(2021)]|uniref:CGNR zinc finger domain-containing protein n=1 Tax=Paenibacillus sp. R14(2021) TaxID=2859228 RepID=UPI001C6168D3|nr:CGNR zinc finger domain-containing protein [Paenibacillus sp. R14(2021)]
MSLPFVWLGNHTAIDFLNTRKINKGKQQELLTTFEDIEEWLRTAGFLHRITGIAELNAEDKIRIHAEVVEVRELLQTAVDALIQGEIWDQQWIDHVNALLQANAGYLRVANKSESLRSEMIYEAHRLAGFFMEQLVRLTSECVQGKIKKCSNPECILHFYDHSRNGSRRWCDVTTCGNRVKVNQYYHRKKARLTK